MKKTKKIFSLLLSSVIIGNSIFASSINSYANESTNNPEITSSKTNTMKRINLNSIEAQELEVYSPSPLSRSTSGYPRNIKYTKIGDEVYGNTGDINTINETVWRGNLVDNDLGYDNNTYEKLDEKTNLYFLEYGKVAFTRFKDSNDKTIDVAHFLATGNTGKTNEIDNQIEVDYSTVVKNEDINISSLEKLLGNRDAIGYNKVLDISDFKNMTLKYIESFTVSCKETSEIEYILTCETKDGNIEKYAFSVENTPLSLHPEKNSGEDINVSFTYRHSYFDDNPNVPKSKVVKYGNTLKNLPYPQYRVSDSPQNTMRTYKIINGWYYDNRHHEYRFNENEPLIKDTDLYVSYNIGTRTKGKDRYETANIAAQSFQQSDDIILVNGEEFADALSASTLAYLKSAPILLTQSNSLNNNTLNVIKNLKAKRVTIVGGPGSVNESIFQNLKRNGLTVDRIHGKDRYETSIAAANEVLKGRDYISTIAVVDGRNYPDALSAINLGNRYGSPVILTNSSNINSINNFINSFSIKKAYIVGGYGSVSPHVEDSLQTRNKLRLHGKDRYETNIAVVNEMSFKNHSVTLVSGENYADALVSGPTAGLRHANIFVVNNSSVNNKNLKNNLQKWGVHETFTIGGDSWISFETEKYLTNVGAKGR